MMDEEFVSKVQVGAGASSLEFLQACYRSPHLPLSTRMRAAIAALQFEHFKLGVSVTIDGGDLAERLDKAIQRSERARLINGNGSANGEGSRPKVIERSANEGSGLRRI